MAAVQQQIQHYYEEVAGHGWEPKPRDTAAGCLLLEAEPNVQAEAIRRMLVSPLWGHGQRGLARSALLDALFARHPPLGVTDLENALDMVSRYTHGRPAYTDLWPSVVEAVARHGEQHPLSDPMRETLARMRDALFASHTDDRRLRQRIEEVLGNRRHGRPVPGDAWAEAALRDLGAMEPEAREAWHRLLAHAQDSEASKPSGKWLTQAAAHIEAVGGPDAFARRATDWFGRVALPDPLPRRAFFMEQTNQDILCGLIWSCGAVDDQSLAPPLGGLAEACSAWVPDHGPWARRHLNACIHTLGRMPGVEPVAQLERLKTSINHRVTRTLIDKALEASVKRAGTGEHDSQGRAADGRH